MIIENFCNHVGQVAPPVKPQREPSPGKLKLMQQMFRCIRENAHYVLKILCEKAKKSSGPHAELADIVVNSGEQVRFDASVYRLAQMTCYVGFDGMSLSDGKVGADFRGTYTYEFNKPGSELERVKRLEVLTRAIDSQLLPGTHLTFGNTHLGGTLQLVVPQSDGDLVTHSMGLSCHFGK